MSDHDPTDVVHLADPTIDPSAFVAPGTHIYGDVTVAANAVIMFGTVIRAELDRVVIGERSNIQDNSVIHVDEGFPCVIGDDVTVGHMAMLHGTTLGNGCLIGIGARVLNGSEVGEGALLAAGSLLPEGKSVPPWTLAMGVPAKPVRELTEDEIARNRDGVAHYLSFAAAYRAKLEGDGSA